MAMRRIYPVLGIVFLVVLFAWCSSALKTPVKAQDHPVPVTTCWHETTIVCGNPAEAPEGAEWVR